MKTRYLLTAMAASSWSWVAAAQTMYVETFDDGINHTNWTWEREPGGSIPLTGGNPAGFFQSDLVPVPSLFCSDPLFTGDFRSRRVGSLGGDLRTVEFSSRPGPISLVLSNFNGTPGNPVDDSFAHFVTSIQAPVTPEAGWVSFDVTIPFGATSTPSGWVMTGLLPFQPPTIDWNQMITHVDEVIVTWNNSLQPVLLFDVVRGGDNLRVTYDVPEPGTLALLGLAGALCVRLRRPPAASAWRAGTT